MSASLEYITRLEAHATQLRETNARMADKALAMGPGAIRAIAPTLERNRVEAERYSDQANWHRNDNGQAIAVWPVTKPWRD